ncbi:hypothetical protein [Providencia sp. wls1950]|uniref:hypothetical protein n=1 Tax=Providencia sp. wls1950 TaxID=2675147 RepID=UPI0012B599A5|nr:hypothetical protein [Providencia sp. wls1950]MTB44089.1 hypothetical protein [Providencia sp. wls1950]
MDDRRVPSIYLFNTDLKTNEKLHASGFNVQYYKLNGYVNCESSDYPISIPYKNNIPTDIHEAEILVIDTNLDNFRHADNQPCPMNINLHYTPPRIDLLPIDIAAINRQLFSTKKEQIVIVFCRSHTNMTCEVDILGARRNIKQEYKTYSFNQSLGVIDKHGKRFKKPEKVIAENIKSHLFKYLEDSYYHVAFKYTGDNEIILAKNEADDVVSLISMIGNKFLFFLPDIKNKSDFLDELFSFVLPDIPGFSEIFPSNGTFQWINNSSYITHEEKLKLESIEELKKDFNEKLFILENEYLTLANKEENIKTKALLTATDDELVNSVKWFLEYIGFNNITAPDDKVNEAENEIFEEDLNIETEQKTYLFEVKGIGGTSTDAQCSQISKIVLRREDTRDDHDFKGIYIVNHQRYKDPQERVNPPFNDTQIMDARIARRGMTYTYELFQVYHMIEEDILTRDDVRVAFEQTGLIDFRKSLNLIKCAHVYPKPEVYSFDLTATPDITISKNDRIAVRDKDNHWHLLSIESIEVNKNPLEEATVISGGNVGVKVDKFIENAKDFYLKKA